MVQWAWYRKALDECSPTDHGSAQPRLSRRLLHVHHDTMSSNHFPDWMKGLGTIVLVLLVPWCWFVGMVSAMEGRVAFDPYVDTWFAPGFDPALEDSIRIGQRREEVVAILGVPLFMQPPGYMCQGAIRYDYTQDGGHDRRLGIEAHEPGKDFAWHRFSVCFDSTGVVCDIDDGWSYD